MTIATRLLCSAVVASIVNLRVHAVTGDLPLYDCDMAYDGDGWKQLWTTSWKDWCCVHRSRGCPSTSTATTTASSGTTMTRTSRTETTTSRTSRTETATSTETTATTTTTNLGCRTNCTKKIFDRRTLKFTETSGTCEERIRWGMRDVKLLDGLHNLPADKFHPAVCKKSGTWVMGQCSVCDVCSIESFCEKEVAAKLRPVLMSKKCSASCHLDGHSATCEDRMRWTMKHNPQVIMSANPCMAAAEMVKAQCAVCDDCSAKLWCARYAQETSAYEFRKFEKLNESIVLPRMGLSDRTSALCLMFCVATGVGFALLQRSRTATLRLMTESAREIDASSEPLCPLSDRTNIA